MVTRPVITSMAHTIRLHWRRVVAVTWGWRHCKSATISTIGVLRCGVGVVVLHNATLHDNGPPYLIFGEGIGMKITDSLDRFKSLASLSLVKYIPWMVLAIAILYLTGAWRWKPASIWS